MPGFEALAPATPPPDAPTGGFAALAAPKSKAAPKPQHPWYEPITSALNTAEKKGVAALQWASETPVARGADAVLNADTRFGMAGLQGKNPFKAVMDPAHATEDTHNLERKIGLPVAGDKAPWWQHALQFGEDFGVETIGSPSTYVPFLGEADILKRIGHYGLAAGSAIELAKQAGKIEPVARLGAKIADTGVGRGFASLADKAKGGISEFYNERKDVTRAGENLIKDREISGKTQQKRAEENYANFIDEHRPAIEEYETSRDAVRAEMAEIKDAADAGAETAQRMYVSYQQELEDLKKAPGLAPVRDALLQRAYVEGTPEVRRKVLAKGFTPTAEQQAQKPLNILHNFNDEYEPTQKLMSDAEQAEADRLRAQSPVHYVRQGSKKAKFDLPKSGGTPETPLADRLLDRLVTGSRLENHHATRRDILEGLGLNAGVIDDNMRRTLERLHDAKQKAGTTEPGFGDLQAKRAAARVAAYETLLKKQQAALDAAEAKRNIHLQSGAYNPLNLKGQQVENVDPITAKQHALNDSRTLGEPLRKIATVGGKGSRRKIIVPLNPHDTNKDTRKLEGKIMGLNRNVTDAEITARGARNAAAQAVKRIPNAQKGLVSEIKRNQEQARADALRLHNAAVKHTASILPKRLVKPGVEIEPWMNVSKQRRNAVTSRTFTNFRRAEGPFQKILAAANKSTDTIAKGISGPTGAHVGATEARKIKALVRNEDHIKRLQLQREYNASIKTMEKHGKDISRAINTVPIPKFLHDRLYGSFPHYEKSLAAKFSDLQRDALFVLPFAHMKNIAVLTALGPGGVKTLKNGFMYAERLRKAETLPDAELAARVTGLEQRGATEHYIKENEPGYVHALPGGVGEKLADFADKGNRALERHDLGMRLALEDELRHKGVPEPAIGGEIRDVLGDYANQAPVIRELRNRLGASFPGWGLGIVPRAMHKAALEQPRAVQAYARAQRLASDDVTEPAWGTDFDAGGPAEDYAKLWERPDKFVGSPSRIGVPGLVAGLTGAAAFGEPLQYLGEQALHAVPFSSVATSGLGWPFPSTAPGVVNAAEGLAGAYNQNHKSMRARTNELNKLGLRGAQITQVLMSEGYIPYPKQRQAAPVGGGFGALAK